MVKNLDQYLHGTDKSKEISLFEYGLLVARAREVCDTEGCHEDEYFVLYKMDNNQYGSGYLRESELDDYMNGRESWFEADKVLAWTGATLDEWLASPFERKLSDCIGYYGHENIMGTDYDPQDELFARSAWLGESMEDAITGAYPSVDVLIGCEHYLIARDRDNGKAYYLYVDSDRTPHLDHCISELYDKHEEWTKDMLRGHNLNMIAETHEDAKTGDEWDILTECGAFDILLDEVRGIYIPRDFANIYGDSLEPYDGIEEDLRILKEGPDNEAYWEAMDSVCAESWLNLDGKEWDIEQDGDLWIYERGKPRANQED